MFLKKITRHVIIVRFKITGVSAMEANFPSVFKQAPISEVAQMNKRNGKVNLAKSTVSSFFNVSSEKPGAINEITSGVNISSNITKKNKKIINIENIFEKN